MHGQVGALFQAADSSLRPYMEEEARELSGASFMKLILSMRAPRCS